MQFGYPTQFTVMVTSTEEMAAVYGVLAKTMNHDVPSHMQTGDGTMSATLSEAKPAVAEPVEEEPVEEELEVEEQDTEVDSAGVPFDPELHTGTKKKDGTWRAKKGKADEAAAVAEEVAEEVETEEEPEDDEFAAFKEAAAVAEEVAEEVEVPERTWTDADLGQLCNDAAVKLGNPAPVKALIAKYVPEGEVPHSRNIPNDQREAFAQEVEAEAGIEYVG